MNVELYFSTEVRAKSLGGSTNCRAGRDAVPKAHAKRRCPRSLRSPRNKSTKASHPAFRKEKKPTDVMFRKSTTRENGRHVWLFASPSLFATFAYCPRISKSGRLPTRTWGLAEARAKRCKKAFSRRLAAPRHVDTPHSGTQKNTGLTQWWYNSGAGRPSCFARQTYSSPTYGPEQQRAE